MTQVSKEEKKTIKQIRDALIRVSWDVNATKKGAGRLLVAYPNDVLCELFGEELTKNNWINDKEN